MEIVHTAVPHEHEGEYDAFIQRINDRFNGLTGPVFETNATGLYAAYLASFADGAERQYHTCNCCKNFIERFGHLAIVSADGTLVSAIWDAETAPANYQRAVSEMARIVRRAKITMPFLSGEAMYGTPISGTRKDDSGDWHHFAVAPNAGRIYKSPLKTAFQAASEKREEFNTVMHALADWSKEAVTTALHLLKNDQLGNSAAAVAQAQFLADLHAINVTGQLRRNLVFAAVAVAPAGFCHPRSSMIATLLDDIATGKSFDQVQAAWNAKMHPLAYQRPTAAPTAGAIAAAEVAFEKMGAASALQRRYATLADVLDKLWEPKPAKQTAPAGGIFASVKAKDQTAVPAITMRAPAIAITWDKFARTVLPTADQIEVYAESGHAAYAALTTATDPEAMPLLQWDSIERRNPVALYLYHAGSLPKGWNLEPRTFHKVNAITLRPSQWFGDERFGHHPKGALFIIDGCRDLKGAGGLALFPSTVRSEFHGVRSVIEAYSNTNQMTGREEASASGLLIGAQKTGNPLVRVTSASQMTEYRIDRWD